MSPRRRPGSRDRHWIPACAGMTDTSGALDYLSVDSFLRTLVDARALKTAFEVGLIDYLIERPGPTLEALEKSLSLDHAGAQFLLGLLAANHVIERRDGAIHLHERFAAVLRYRDLVETKLDFAGFTMNDFADLFTALIRDPRSFAGKARLFELFDYRRCLQFSPENYERTRGWMRLTSTLTRYEARACMTLFDFGAHKRMLDVGGNSGEFVLQVARANPALHGTAFDLPLVCEIGLEYVLAEPEHDRITFVKGDIRNDILPRGYDLITFKSMLHDWPIEDAQRFLAKAARALEPGGTILIFERGPIELAQATPPFSMLPVLLFFRSYRGPEGYMKHLEALGFDDIQRREVELDTGFFLITARKTGSTRVH
jgi:ubiquinone/menaquinone biosynthesis C-methylase UbiE